MMREMQDDERHCLLYIADFKITSSIETKFSLLRLVTKFQIEYATQIYFNYRADSHVSPRA